MVSSTHMYALSLRGSRDFCKRHRFTILAVTSAAVAYLYAHKLIAKAIHDYKNRNNPQAQSTLTAQDYVEGFSDSLVKITKLVGTIFKLFRAATCPDEGKLAGDQWLDDFSQMA